MKRDMDLIRKMVLAVEDAPSGYAPDHAIEGYSPEQVGYHAYLLVDAGLAIGFNMTTHGESSPNWRLLHLTWEGHEFADAAREESRWNTAKRTVKEKAGTVSVGVLTQLLGALAKQQVGVP